MRLYFPQIYKDPEMWRVTIWLKIRSVYPQTTVMPLVITESEDPFLWKSLGVYFVKRVGDMLSLIG